MLTDVKVHKEQLRREENIVGGALVCFRHSVDSATPLIYFNKCYMIRDSGYSV